MTRGAAAGAALIALTSCGKGLGAAATAPDRPYAGVLIAPNALGDDFLDRQKISATYGDRSVAFDAVLQKQGNELTLLGLTPFGSRAFVVRQTGTDVSFESFVSTPPPFPPRYILIDVQRVFLAWVRDDDVAASDGEFEAVRNGEVVTERWQDGRLLRRTFRRVDGNPRGEIVVEYEGGMARPGPPPPHVVFTNGWYGYRLDIRTETHQPL